MSSVPFGAIDGFLLPADIREIAEHYGVRASALRVAFRKPVDQRTRDAFDALVWKLTRQRGVPASLAASLLRTDVDTVVTGARAHEARIAVYKRGICSAPVHDGHRTEL